MPSCQLMIRKVGMREGHQGPVSLFLEGHGHCRFFTQGLRRYPRMLNPSRSLDHREPAIMGRPIERPVKEPVDFRIEQELLGCIPGIFGSSHPSNTSVRGAGIVRSNLNSRVFLEFSISPSLLLVLLRIAKIQLKLIQTLVPEPLVLMHPSCYLPKRLPTKGDKDLSTVLFAFNESCTFEHFEMLRYRVQSRVVRPCNIQESSRSVCQLPNDRSPSRVGNGCKDVCQLIHAHITPCGVMSGKPNFGTVAGTIFCGKNLATDATFPDPLSRPRIARCARLATGHSVYPLTTPYSPLYN
jgi:hypothetical protein